MNSEKAMRRAAQVLRQEARRKRVKMVKMWMEAKLEVEYAEKLETLDDLEVTDEMIAQVSAEIEAERAGQSS
jgi:hypothetical protein